MNGNRMMGRGMNVPEKSKRGIKGILKELFSYSQKLKIPMVIALCLAAAGAVLTIIGPNQLSRITDLISEGLTSQIDLSSIAKVGILLLCLYLFSGLFRFLYKGIIIKHNKTEPTYTKTSLFLCEKRRFFMARTEKGGNIFKLAGPRGLAFFHLIKKEVSKWPMKK